MIYPVYFAHMLPKCPLFGGSTVYNEAATVHQTTFCCFSVAETMSAKR